MIGDSRLSDYLVTEAAQVPNSGTHPMMSHYSCMDIQDQNPSRPSSLGIRLNSGVQNFTDMKNAQRSTRTYQLKRDGQDMEKVLGQISNNGSTPITPTSFLNPKEITADQEHFADQLSKSFDRLKNEREGCVSSLLMPLVSVAAAMQSSLRESGEVDVPVSSSAASPTPLHVNVSRQIKSEMPQHSSTSIPNRMDEDRTDGTTIMLSSSLNENVLYNLMPPQQQHGSPSNCLSSSSCGGAILSNCSSSTSSTSPPPPSLGDNSNNRTTKQQLQHQFADEELMHLPHLNHHHHHQFTNSNRPSSLSLPPLGPPQDEEDEDDAHQELRYPDLTAAAQGLCDVLGGQLQQHHVTLIGDDGDDRIMPTLLSSIASSTTNNTSTTTDTFMNLFNSQNNNGDQNGLIGDGMDQHMRNLNPRLTAANLINYGLQDVSTLSSIQMLRPQQSHHQDFMQHHQQSSLLMGTGMTIFPDLQHEQHEQQQQQHIAHLHQQQQRQQGQLHQTSTNVSPVKPTTIAAAARKRALSNATTAGVESGSKKRPANTRRRHEPTIAAAQALVNSTVIGGNYSMGCGNNGGGRSGGLSMLDNCRIPLKVEATTPRHFDADVDDTSTQSSSVQPVGENSDPIDQSIQKVEKKRARNRLAARRCRERKVTRIQTLEQEVESLTAYVDRLKNELDHSRNETNQLRIYLDQISESFPNLSEKLKTISPVVTSVQKP